MAKIYWEDYGPDEDIPIKRFMGCQIRSVIAEENGLVVSLQYFDSAEDEDNQKLSSIHLLLNADIADDVGKNLRKSARRRYEETSDESRDIH
jgi:hypothetical protein